MTPVDLVGRSEELGDALELLGAELAGEGRPPVRRHGPPDLFGTAVELRRHLDLDAAAIVRVGNASCKSHALQAVDYPGHGACGQPGLHGQLPRRQPTAVLDDVEAVQVGLVDAEALGREVVE